MRPVANDTAVLITGSRTLAIGLSSLLLSIPPIDHVECLTSLDQLDEMLNGSQPVLVILDSALAGDNLTRTTETIHHLAPDSLRIILSENIPELRELVFVSDATVIVKGAEPARLARTLEYLISDHIVA